MKSSPLSVPPRFASALVGLCTRAADRDSVLGDLEEEFRFLAARDGGERARRWYRSQALRSAGSLFGLRISTAPGARPCGAAVAGAFSAIAAASLFGAVLARWLDPSPKTGGLTISLVICSCALLSSTCGGWASTLAVGGRDRRVLTFVGAIVIAPDLVLAGLTPGPWNPLFLGLAVVAVCSGLTLGGRLGMANLTHATTNRGAT